MRNLLLSAAVTAFAATGALAADLSSPIPEVYPAPVAQVYDWTGFYAGLHGGFGFGSIEDVGNPNSPSHSTNGPFGGIQLGYNVQSGNFVWGIEADASISGVTADWVGVDQFDPYYGKDTQKAFGTVRARLGYAFDRFMPYVTGGLAWTHNEFGFGCENARAPASLNACSDPTEDFYVQDKGSALGWTVGAGAEMAVTDRWTIKAEYLYADYGKISRVMADPNWPGYTAARDFKTITHAVKIGANYRF